MAPRFLENLCARDLRYSMPNSLYVNIRSKKVKSCTRVE